MDDRDIATSLADARAHLASGRVDSAMALCAGIMATEPRHPESMEILARVSLAVGRAAAALPFARILIDDHPRHSLGWALYADILLRQDQCREAAAAALHAADLDGTDPACWRLGGVALMRLGRFQAAVDHLRRGTGQYPGSAMLRGCLALALHSAGQDGEALAQAAQARALDAHDPDAAMAMVSALAATGRYEDAIAQGRAAILACPGIQSALSYVVATALLVTGQFDEGYAMMDAARIGHDRAAPHPYWQGDAAPGKHIVLYGEQGYGDFLQFVRFAPRVAAKVGRVSLRVPQPLERLLRASMPEAVLSVYQPATGQGRTHADDPLLDFPLDTEARASLLSLPHLLKLGAQTDADHVPYLRAPPDLAAVWRDRLAALPSPRLGLVWAGSPQNGNDHNRSISFEALRPLIDAHQGHWVSLQMGGGAQAAEAGMWDATTLIHDFADSAAVLACLDVLITVDTSVAHLAGGMGVPVGLMLPFDPDWRWQIGRDDTPWYPSMRLFRQSSPGDWAGVVARLCAAALLSAKG